PMLPLRVRRLQFPYEEELLARIDETELAVGDVLYGLRVCPQPPRLLPQLSIVSPYLRQRCFERAVLLAGLQHRKEAPVPDEGVDNQDASDRDHDVAKDST